MSITGLVAISSDDDPVVLIYISLYIIQINFWWRRRYPHCFYVLAACGATSRAVNGINSSPCFEFPSPWPQVVSSAVSSCSAGYWGDKGGISCCVTSCLL